MDVHIAGVDHHEHRYDAEGHGHQDVGGELSLGRQGLDVALDFAALADGFVDLVQDFGEVPPTSRLIWMACAIQTKSSFRIRSAVSVRED